MSWDSYIDNLIAETKDANGEPHCDKACIIGIDGGDPLTTAGHPNALKLQRQEGSEIAKAFKRKDFSEFQRFGIKIERETYQFTGEKDGSVLGRKTNHGSVVLKASKTAIVIAHCPEHGQQGNTVKGVEIIVGYLESLGM